MKISSSAYFGVETLVRLAACDADRPCTAEWLARSINRSVSYTETLLAELRKAGLVKAKQGPGGGYNLNRPADRITFADVFRAFHEPRTRAGRSVAPMALSQSETDALHDTDLLWEALKSSILLFLEDVSLSDIASADDDALAEGETCNSAAFQAGPQSTACH